jgi:hypothetical protein
MVYFNEPTIDERTIDIRELSFDKLIINKPSIHKKIFVDVGSHLKPNRNNSDILADYNSYGGLNIKLYEESESEANILLLIT